MTREEKKELAHKVLLLVAAAGFLSIAVIAPGLVSLLTPFRGRKYIPQEKFRQAVRYGLGQRWLSVKKTSRGERLILTENGKRRVLKGKFTPSTIKPPKRWDRKWRVVIFDIPNSQKTPRDILRDTLRLLGFRQLQESVWIHPFPCEREVEDLATLYQVRPYVRVLLVQRFHGENEYLGKFNLQNYRK